MTACLLASSSASLFTLIATLGKGRDLLHMLGVILLADEEPFRRINDDQVMCSGDGDGATGRTVDQVALRLDLDMSRLVQTDDRVAIRVRAVQLRHLAPAPDVIPANTDRDNDEAAGL